MPMLDHAQRVTMQAIDRGPRFMPEGLFAGQPERAALALRVHANTISHARLVALEETFPRTRARLGHDRFNALCRDYIELPQALVAPLALIGGGLPEFLAGIRDAADTAELSRFEWLWLEAYHAADAVPLRLADLAGIEPDELLQVAVCAHPSARASRFGAALLDVLAHDVPGLAAAEAVLIVRPDADVLISPASKTMCAMVAAAKNPLMIGNLLALPAEPDGMDQPSPEAAMQALVALLHAGALRKAG